MTKTLKQLQEEHPEWCFRCGYSLMDVIHTGAGDPEMVPCDSFSEPEIVSPVIAALIAAKREDEARIAELEEELRKADEALTRLASYADWVRFRESGAYITAITRQTQRAADAAKEE